MLSNRLKQLRAEKNIKQDDLAEYLNVKRQTYSAYERGVSIPDANTLKSIATFFNVSTDYLLGSTDDPTPAQELSAARVAGGRDYSDLTPEQIEKIKSYEAFLRSQSGLEEK